MATCISGTLKQCIIGFEYARRYHGKFIVRFDDTNPAAESKEYYDAFLDSFEWLQIKPDLVRNSSDDMEKFYSLAEKMLRSRNAFVCTCTQEKMREFRGAMINCEHRTQGVEESLQLMGTRCYPEAKQRALRRCVSQGT